MVASGGTKTYNYADLQACVQDMTKFHNDLLTYVDDLVQQKNRLLGPDWNGKAADGDYNGKVQEIHTTLNTSADAINQLSTQLGMGADAMSETDQTAYKGG